MSFLSKEESEALKKNPDLAAVAEKLEKGQFIPKDRFDEVNKKAKEAVDAVKKFEDERNAEAERVKAEKERVEAERMSKAGEWSKINEAEKLKTTEALAKLSETQKELVSEKGVADMYRTWHKSKADKIKEALADKWLPEYESFSIDSLEKIAVQFGHEDVVDTSTLQPNKKKEPPKSYDEMTPEEFAKVQEDAKRGKLAKT